MANELVPIQPQFNIPNMMILAESMAKSGYYPDVRDVHKAITKIIMGHELGFGPAVSMSSIHNIQGKPVLSATLIAALIKRSQVYDYEIVELGDKVCTLSFLGLKRSTNKWGVLGQSKFTESDAKNAGLLGKDNWKKYARNMYFSRAISNGARWYTPDVFGGCPVYTPDELGMVEDDEGNIITVRPEPTTIPTPVSSPASNVVTPKMIEGLITEVGADRTKVLEYLGTDTLEKASQESLVKIQKILQARKKI